MGKNTPARQRTAGRERLWRAHSSPWITGVWSVERALVETSITSAIEHNPAPGRGAGETQGEPRKPRGFAANSVDEVLRRLELDVGHDKVQRYFNGQTRFAMTDNRLDIIVASGFLAQFLDRQFGDSLRRAAASDTPDTPQVQVSFQVDRAAFEPSAPAPAAKAPVRHRPRPKPLGRFRFDTFIVGASNRLAHAAAMRVADEEANPAPLFLHGSCGLGKTHLLHAIAGRFPEVRPGAHVKYTTAEAFTNEFITAIRTGKVDAFRKTYRKVDLLCIDDVHFLASKEQTQTEMMHTFDAIGLDGARVVLASDEHPRDIRKLSEKLVSRFMAGAVVRIDTPDEELRARLLASIADSRGMQLDEAAMKLICERTARSIGSLGGFGGSVRELEGLLNQVEAVHRLLPDCGVADGRIGVGLVRRALGLTGTESPTGASPSPALRPRRPIAAQTIVAEVCRALCVDLSDFMGKGRHPRVVLARSLTAYICRRLTTLSFPEIARAMGRGNHSTVITAHRRVERDLARKGEPLAGELVPNHSGNTLSEVIEAISRHIVRGATGL